MPANLSHFEKPTILSSSRIIRPEILCTALIAMGLASCSGCFGDDARGGDVESSQAVSSSPSLSTVKMEDLPPEARNVLENYYKGIFAETPSGHHVSECVDVHNGHCTCTFTGTGDAVWSDLELSGSPFYGLPHLRFANLQFQLSKVALTTADGLNKVTTKYLVVLQADAVQGLKTGQFSGTAWYDTSKGLDLPKAFLRRSESGKWSVSSPISSEWTTPDEDFDLSEL